MGHITTIEDVRAALRECHCGRPDCGFVVRCPRCEGASMKVVYLAEPDRFEFLCDYCADRIAVDLCKPKPRWKEVERIYDEPKGKDKAKTETAKVVSLFGAKALGGAPGRPGELHPVPSRGRPASRGRKEKGPKPSA